MIGGSYTMKLYIEAIKLLILKFIFRKNSGTLIKKFCEKMGIVYIKLAQMLATQNYGNLFTENDRQNLSSICDNCNPIKYKKIIEILKREYGENLYNIFTYIDENPVGSASVSQIHRAILKNGDEVAIKIKRSDVSKTIKKDIKRIKKIVHRFGKIINFKNFTGGDYALNLYLEWIEQETDFRNEVKNINEYQKFADTVNNQVAETKTIKIPKIYEEYCTDDIIVMEFIKTPTINKIELNEENKSRIVEALNSYIKLSFWALFNDEKVTFHGDPHSGNIALDEEGNICFLDMGLLCTLSREDATLCRQFYLTAYAGNYEKLYEMLVSYGDMNDISKTLFKEDCRQYCEQIKEKEVTYYFIDMINVCLKYEFVPPKFLFGMAKAFICLNGISNFSNNQFSAHELLSEQTIEYLIQRSINDCLEIIEDGLKLPQDLIKNTIEHGIINTIAKITSETKINIDIKRALDNLEETFELIKTST